MRSGGFPCRFDGCSAQFHVADAKSMESLREASANRTAHEQAAHDYRHPSPPPEQRWGAPRIAKPRSRNIAG